MKIPYHNPCNLTNEQVGASEGWRLLTKDEINVQLRAGLCFLIHDGEWSDAAAFATYQGHTYRTKDPLPEKYLIGNDLDWFDDGYINTLKIADNKGLWIQYFDCRFRAWVRCFKIFPTLGLRHRIHPDDVHKLYGDSGGKESEQDYHSSSYIKKLFCEWVDGAEIEAIPTILPLQWCPCSEPNWNQWKSQKFRKKPKIKSQDEIDDATMHKLYNKYGKYDFLSSFNKFGKELLAWERARVKEGK